MIDWKTVVYKEINMSMNHGSTIMLVCIWNANVSVYQRR